MIIGITGLAGAGKDTAANYLATALNTKHISGGDIRLELNVSAHGLFFPVIRSVRIIPATVPLDNPHFLNAVPT